mmetsp:Transcript_30612/g.33447  ORF Transcript_30612/g.33447 Transcript_30612/m.33447 type:complete len:428 (-) Transcript_30612:87-1370(-)
MASAHRLKVPAFDLSWYEFAHKEQPHVFLLMPGGGGSTKSGVKNQIILAKSEYPGGNELEFVDPYLTDSDGVMALCTGIAHGVIQGKDMILALVDAFCLVLEVSMDEEKKSLRFERRVRFQVDFHEETPSANTCLIMSFGAVVTAGEDGTVRTWLIDEEKGEWKASKIFDLKDHTAPVSALSEHPSEPWVVSAGKDGSCKIWDVKNGSLLIDIPYLIDGIPNFDAKKMKMECRGVHFSIDGDSIYSIQSPRKGSTYLIKWGIEKKEEKVVDKVESEDEDEKKLSDKKEQSKTTTVLVTFYDKKKEVHKVPSTRLAMSEDGKYLAIGASDGSVSVVEVEKLKEVKKVSCHDLPVTGLGFAPQHLTKEKELDFFIATCSADNKLNLIKVKGYSPITRFLIILVLIVVILSLFLLTTGLHIEVSRILGDK